MADKSKIEWTEATWNPVTGCTKVSPGCDHCYAETFAERWRGTPGHHFEQGFDLTLRPERLDQPLRWTKPRRIFVNSMSDLFHDDIPDEFIARVFAVMAAAPQHTFQLLTKRHGRMRSLLNDQLWRSTMFQRESVILGPPRELPTWPLSNVWLGVSVEDQKWAGVRIPALIDTPAAVRWISAEPLLGPVSLTHTDKDALVDGGLDWVVVGGESGAGARPMHPDWARQLRDECLAADVAFHFKQHGQFAPVRDRPTQGDHWLYPTGESGAWHHGDGHTRLGRGDYISPLGGATLMRRSRSKHDAGRLLDGLGWNQYPEPAA